MNYAKRIWNRNTGKRIRAGSEKRYSKWIRSRARWPMSLSKLWTYATSSIKRPLL